MVIKWAHLFKKNEIFKNLFNESLTYITDDLLIC